MDQKAIALGFNDNVATSVTDLALNRECVIIMKDKSKKTILIRDNIPFGHKVALSFIGKAEKVIKYDEVIGIATQDINIGQHVHVQNLEGLRGRGDLYNK